MVRKNVIDQKLFNNTAKKIRDMVYLKVSKDMRGLNFDFNSSNDNGSSEEEEPYEDSELR